jgi:superfamily II DNA or RNA helicase
MSKTPRKKKVPYYKKPQDLTVEAWQEALRKQFAADQKFEVTNIGEHPVYSDFEVFNPESDKTYKVSVRDNQSSHDFCSCPDFKINGLGTCKHVEYVLAELKRLKKNQKFFKGAHDPEYSSLSIYYGKERRIRLKKARLTTFDGADESIFDSDGFLLHGMTGQLESFIAATTAIDPTFRVYPDVLDYLEEYKKTEKRKALCRDIFREGIDSPIFNDLIKATLYPYQREGVIKAVEAGRILLADEMGLGKTVQAIAAVEFFARYLNVEKVLIICPTSLKYQWKKEIEKFTEREACIVEGMKHKRHELYRQKCFMKIISYGACRNDLEMINDWSPNLVIVDEAQRIKNWKTKTAKAVKQIDAEHAIVLTGTPLENRIDELHSIVEFVDNYKLGPLFKFLDNHQVLDEHGKVKGYTNLRSINKTLSDILLRRTKKEIADQLPGRIDKNFFVEMTKEQINLHNDYYEQVCKLVNKWIRHGFLTEEESQRLLINLNCMRMVSDSTYILDKETNHGNKIDELRELLPEIVENPDNKIVIFSQWKKMFELIIEELNALGLPYVYLNGDMPALERNQIITRFQKEKDLRVFLSTDAGGVGVNLQSANILINIDLPWNPAVLEQRIGRIYRLGQKKHINVFNFISKGSIEHRILYLLEFKKSVFSGAIDEDGNDTVMLEGFLSSVKSLTEVEVDEPVAKEREDSDTLNYRAELKVTDQIEETERAEEEIPEQQIHTETEAEIEIDTKTETGAEIGTGAENGTETATTEYPGNSEANPLVSTDRKTTGTGFLGKIKANVKRVFRKMFGLR